MPTTMTAATIDHYHQNLPELRQVPIPTPGPHDVLVRVIAASLNPLDDKIVHGDMKLLFHFDLPMGMGNDFSGIITAIGQSVTDYAVGDAVYGRVENERIGTFAEYLAVATRVIAPKPTNLSFAEAASLPLVALTAQQALGDLMHLQPGQKVFIPGGSGGVGTVAIQLAKQRGAVVATTTSAANFDLVRQLGADFPLDYHQPDYAAALQDYDAVLDTRGGRDLKAAFGMLKPGGLVVSIGGLPDAKLGREFGSPRWKQGLFALASAPTRRLARQTHTHYRFLLIKPDGKQLQGLQPLIESGKLKPNISRVYPLAEINDALAALRGGHVVGKLVLQIAKEPA